jgi:GNAT superfamily N-acetyltransferase
MIGSERLDAEYPAVGIDRCSNMRIVVGIFEVRHMSAVEVRPSTDQDIREFAGWRYEPPYDAYDITESLVEAVAYFLDPETNCHTLHEGDSVVGYCTFGHDARIRGGDYRVDAVDIGLGVHPQRTGAGEGNRFVSAVVAHAIAASDPSLLRVTVAAGNARALRVWTRAEFSEVSRFSAAREIMGSKDFIVLTFSPGDRT